MDTRVLGKSRPGGSPLAVTPERVAWSVARALGRRRITIYAPWFWRPILWIVRAIQEPIFKRLKL